MLNYERVQDTNGDSTFSKRAKEPMASTGCLTDRCSVF